MYVKTQLLQQRCIFLANSFDQKAIPDPTLQINPLAIIKR